MAGVVRQVRARGLPADDDVSVAAHLLRVQVDHHGFGNPRFPLGWRKSAIWLVSGHTLQQAESSRLQWSCMFQRCQYDILAICEVRDGQDPETGQPLSDQCLAAEFSIAMIAGMDTTTHTLAFFL
jgi:hypothetical protein